jgi:hypothetical protein
VVAIAARLLLVAVCRTAFCVLYCLPLLGIYIKHSLQAMWFLLITYYLARLLEISLNNVVCFLLGNSSASEFYMPMFWNTLPISSTFIPICLWRWNRQNVPKCWHIKFRRQGITQKKAYNVQNTAKVWNQELLNNATIPGDWKKATVDPIYKGGDQSAVSNYRPISLTSVICRQLEHIIGGYLRQVWDENDWLYEGQHGLDQDTHVKVKSSQCART